MLRAERRLRTRGAICYSSAAAVATVLDLVVVFMLARSVGTVFGTRLRIICGLALLSVLLPAWARFGAKKKDRCAVWLFCSLSYCMGWTDALIAIMKVLVIGKLLYIQGLLEKCPGESPSTDCDDSDRDELLRLCERWYPDFDNSTAEEVLSLPVAEATELLSKDGCLDSLADLRNFVFYLVVITLAVRAASAALQCAAGHNGKELYNVLKVREIEGSDSGLWTSTESSESASSDEESGGSSSGEGRRKR